MNYGHLDVNPTLSCNLRCISCSHASPFTAPYFMEPETMARDLAMLKPFLHFDKITLAGGEPTLHPKLREFVDLAKQSGVADKVALITNGTRIHQLKGDVFWNLDEVRISVYGEKLTPAMREAWEKKCAEFDVTLELMPFPEFYKQFKRERDDGVEAFTHCRWKTECFTVHERKFFLCPQSAFFHKKFEYLTEGEDGLPLDDLTAEKLAAFMNRTEPFKACQICCGGFGESAPWGEAKTKEEWMSGSVVKG